MAKRKDLPSFIIFILIGLVPLIYIFSTLIQEISNYKELVKMASTIILPLPIALFSASLLASKKRVAREPSKRDAFISVGMFVLAACAAVSVILLYDQLSTVALREQKLAPLLINSSLLFLYSINYLIIEDIRLAGISGGLLLGFTIYFFL